MVGIGRGAIKANGETDTSTGFAYGAGIQFTPLQLSLLMQAMKILRSLARKLIVL